MVLEVVQEVVPKCKYECNNLSKEEAVTVGNTFFLLTGKDWTASQNYFRQLIELASK